jgi:hypothetical protein
MILYEEILREFQKNKASGRDKDLEDIKYLKLVKKSK